MDILSALDEMKSLKVCALPCCALLCLLCLLWSAGLHQFGLSKSAQGSNGRHLTSCCLP